jgi:hypothetical protein
LGGWYSKLVLAEQGDRTYKSHWRVTAMESSRTTMACTHRGLSMFLYIPASSDLSTNAFRDGRLIITSSERVASKEKIVAQALI